MRPVTNFGLGKTSLHFPYTLTNKLFFLRVERGDEKDCLKLRARVWPNTGQSNCLDKHPDVKDWHQAMEKQATFVLSRTGYLNGVCLALEVDKKSECLNNTKEFETTNMTVTLEGNGSTEESFLANFLTFTIYATCFLLFLVAIYSFLYPGRYM